MYELEVIENVTLLQLKLTHSSGPNDVWTLHTLWLMLQNGENVSKQYPKLEDFESALRKRRSKRFENVYSNYNIPFSTPLETAIDVNPLHWSDTKTTVLYVDF